MTFLERGRVLARAWSVQIAAIGAALSALLLAVDPATLQAAWAGLPPELRQLIPAQFQQWITMALFAAVALVRALPQPGVQRRLSLLGAAAPAAPAWLAAARAQIARAITTIAVHCTATTEGRDFTVAEITGWHRARGFATIGYHFVIHLDGSIETGRPKAQAGAHVAGHNSRSIGVVYVGGLDRLGRPKDTRTPAQRAAMIDLLTVLKTAHPAALIQGHRDYSPDLNGNGRVDSAEWLKACPCFDAKAEYAGLSGPGPITA